MTKCIKKFMICLSMYLLAGCMPQTGPTGATGNTGPAGSNGTNCTVSVVPADPTVAPNGGSLISCTDGTSSLILNGTNGLNGNAGTNGTDGIDGTNGTNGTVITPIQFCPGIPSYPSTFPEVGFCINNSIYAVYSANGGFLTEVLPGNWSSDGINSSCNFTVSAGCVITNN